MGLVFDPVVGSGAGRRREEGGGRSGGLAGRGGKNCWGRSPNTPE